MKGTLYNDIDCFGIGVVFMYLEANLRRISFILLQSAQQCQWFSVPMQFFLKNHLIYGNMKTLPHVL